MTKRAFIYCRISQDREGGGLGVERQRVDCAALAARLGLDVLEVFTDNDISASKGKTRPAYEAMLSRLSEVHAVIVWHNDRLTRRPSELERYIDETRPHGTITHTVTAGEFDLSTPTGRMIARVVGATAAQESEQKAVRVQRKALELAQAGRHAGGTRPFGWDVVITPEDRAAKRGGLYVLNAREGEAIASALSEVLAGRPLGSICRDWNDEDRPGGPLLTTTGKAWKPTPLRQVLLRSRNAGIGTFNGEEVSRGVIPQAAPEHVWRAAVAVLSNPARRSGTTNKASHLLTGIAQCHCGEPVTQGRVYSRRSTVTGEKKMHAVYRCQGHGPGHVAKRMAYVESVVHLYVLRYLAAAVRDEPESPESQAEVARLQTELDVLRVRESEGVQLLATGRFSPAQLSDFQASIDAQRADLTASLERLGRDVVPTSQLDRAVLASATIYDRYAAWLALPIDDRRQFVRSHFVIVLHPHTTGTSRVFDPDTVAVHPRKSARPLSGPELATLVRWGHGSGGPAAVEMMGRWSKGRAAEARNRDILIDLPRLVPSLLSEAAPAATAAPVRT